MGRFIKLVFVVAFVGALLLAGSYVGARATVGKFLGLPQPEMGDLSVRFAYQGIPALPGHPRVWEFTFSRVQVVGFRPAKIYVSPKGQIVATVPKDLGRRLEVWAKSKEVQ